MINRTRGTGMATHKQLRVLMLTYFYPPLGGAGVQRALKFSRYLPDSGIVPTIICADSDGYPHDYSLLSEIPPGISVIRIPHTPFLSRILSLRRRLRGASFSGASFKRKSPPSGVASHQSAPASRWRDGLLSAFGALQFPDDKAAWSRRAQRAAVDAMSLVPADVVFSSSPPVSAHFAAMHAARRAHLPWVADFRDLWTGNPAYAAPPWRRALDGRLERRLLAAANGIVTVSGPFESELAKATGSHAPTLVIPNGYDEDDFARIQARSPEPGVYRVVHAGTFYGQRSPQPFLLGVERLLERRHALRDRLRVRFIGMMGSRFDAVLDAFALRWPGVLEYGGYVSHSQALMELVSADMLLLVVGGGSAAEGTIPGKVFEYLRTGRPILLIGPSGSEAGRLIRDCRAGEVVDESRTDEIMAVLDRWIGDGAAPKPDPARAAGFERQVLAGRLADFLFAVHERHQSQA